MKCQRASIIVRILAGVCLLGLSAWGAFGQVNNARTNEVTVERPPANEINASAARARTLEQDMVVSFGLDRVPALRPSLFGTPRWKYAASVIYVLLAFLATKVLDWVAKVWLQRYSARTDDRFGKLALQLLRGPIKVVTFVILLHVGLDLFEWPASIQVWLRRGLQVVVAFSVTYVTLKLVEVLIDYWRQRATARDERTFNEHLFPVLATSLKVFVVVVAVLVTCQNLGLDITAMLASLSIGGLALGLAAQDTVANLFGAVAVFVDKPFRVGDRIKLDSIDGVVESIGMRSTRVRNLDGHLITVPNKTMGNATITNITRRPMIKTEMNIGLTYDTSAEAVRKALGILEAIYRKHPMTADLVISFNKFADSALNLNIVHWWMNTDHRAYVKGMDELNLEIKDRFDKEGIEFAFPTQTLYLKQDIRESMPPIQDETAST